MTGHDHFAEVTRQRCREAGIDLAGAIPLARAAREAETAEECSFVHPHEGSSLRSA